MNIYSSKSNFLKRAICLPVPKQPISAFKKAASGQAEKPGRDYLKSVLIVKRNWLKSLTFYERFMKELDIVTKREVATALVVWKKMKGHSRTVIRKEVGLQTWKHNIWFNLNNWTKSLFDHCVGEYRLKSHSPLSFSCLSTISRITSALHLLHKKDLLPVMRHFFRHCQIQ